MTPDELKAKFWPYLTTVARSYAPAGHEEDYAQEGLIAIWSSLQDKEVPREIDAWGKTIAKRRLTTLYRESRRQLRDERKLMLVDDMNIFDAPALELSEWVDTTRHQEVRDVVAALGEKQREYVELRFWGGYSPADLAEHYGKGGVYSRDLWKSAKRRLTQRLEALVTA